jgi:hypothetical protein
MMLSKYLSAAMILCANHAGTSAIVRIAITNVQTTTARYGLTEPPNICLDEAQLMARSCMVIVL